MTEMNGEPMGEIGLPVLDFLPSPAELAGEEETTKITIAISSHSLKFFRSQARKTGGSYQKMIRRLLDEYVHHAES